jgi:hypothetical protein
MTLSLRPRPTRALKPRMSAKRRLTGRKPSRITAMPRQIRKNAFARALSLGKGP